MDQTAAPVPGWAGSDRPFASSGRAASSLVYLNSAFNLGVVSPEEIIASGGRLGTHLGARLPPAIESSNSGRLISVGSGSFSPWYAATTLRNATADIQLRD